MDFSKKEKQEKPVSKDYVSPFYSGGPHDLGLKSKKYVISLPYSYRYRSLKQNDGVPEDTKLRKVESDILIPDIKRKHCRSVVCAKRVREFAECGAREGFSVVLNCRGANWRLRECLGACFYSEDQEKRAYDQYLGLRAEHRRTGLYKHDRVRMEMEDFERETNWTEKYKSEHAHLFEEGKTEGNNTAKT